jgi:hypothetical protein
MKAEEARKNIKMPFKFQLMYEKVMNKPRNVTLDYLKKDDNLNTYINETINRSKEMVDKTTQEYLKLNNKIIN